MTDQLRDDILSGGYWLIPPPPGAPPEAQPGAGAGPGAIVCCGAVTAEAIASYHAVKEDFPSLGLLVVTSPDRLHADWLQTRRQVGGNTRSSIERLLERLSPDATLVTLLDGHPLTLSWLGSVARHRVIPLGVDRFGQSGNIAELYRAYHLDQQAIIDAIVAACMES